jgi:hypothetical protein
MSTSRVTELVGQLHNILAELVEIEEKSNKIWREHTETLNTLDHETEIIPLKGGQLLKVASFRRKLRLERRKHKHDWYCSKAFNDNFQTVRILNSMNNAQKHLRRQEKAGEDLIKDRGLIASILADKHEPEELETADIVALQESVKQIASVIDSVTEKEEEVVLT